VTDRAQNGLAIITKASGMLAEARTFSDFKAVRDVGMTAIEYARRVRGVSVDAQNDAAEIVLSAERELGRILGEEGPKRGGDRKSKSHDATLNLPDMGITKSQSSRWQSEAVVPEETFREWVKSVRDKNESLYSGHLVKLGKQHKAMHPGKRKKTKPAVADEDAPIVGTLAELVETGQKFGCIYADPPWQYGNQATRASTDNHYPTMTLEQIATEPVADLAADDAHLHLWTTNAFLPEAFGIIRAWGFEYKSCLVWVKPQLGIGNYWRVSHEFLLLGVRGKCPFLNHGCKSWLEADRTKHSQKPAAVRAMVENVSPGPYLEMYGRRSVGGWTVYGNEVEEGLFA